MASDSFEYEPVGGVPDEQKILSKFKGNELKDVDLKSNNFQYNLGSSNAPVESGSKSNYGENALVGGAVGTAYGVGRAAKNVISNFFGKNTDQQIIQRLVESGAITPEAGAEALGMPKPGGRIASEPAGGKMTGNWAAAAGMDDPEALRARTQAEAHKMRLKAIEAEDKIKGLFGGGGSKYSIVPERASLMLPDSPQKAKTYSQVIAELALKNPKLAATLLGMSKVFGSALGGAGAVMEGDEAVNRIREGDIPGAIMSGVSGLSSGVGMVAPATLPVTGPIALATGLGAAGREYVKGHGANFLERMFPIKTGLERN
jgi:hypothetical protein